MSVLDGRQYHTDQVHYLRKAIAYTDNGTTVSLGWIPAGALVIEAGVNVDTAFNGGSTNTVDIGFRNAGDGTTADTDEFADGLALGTAGRIIGTTINTAGDTYFPEGAEVVAPVISTAGASAGSAIVWVQYLVDNT